MYINKKYIDIHVAAESLSIPRMSAYQGLASGLRKAAVRSIEREPYRKSRATKSTHSNPIQSRLCKCSSSESDDGDTSGQVKTGTAKRNTEWDEPNGKRKRR